MTAALDGIRVLNLAGPAGAYCGHLLAALGADVIKVEPPEGDRLRYQPPFSATAEGPDFERSLAFAYHHAGQRAVALNGATPEGRDLLLRLAGAVDAVLESAPLGSRGISGDELLERFPSLVVMSITGFGLSGPYSRFQAPDIVAFAMSGLMFIAGDPAKAPVVAPGQQAYVLGSTQAAYGGLMALFDRRATGKGQRVEVSLQEVMAATEHLVVRYSREADLSRRHGGQSTMAPGNSYPCRDGWIHVFITTPQHWHAFRRWIGDPDVLQGDAWDDSTFRRHNIDIIDPFIVAYTSAHTRDELVAEAQALHLPVVPVNHLDDFVAHPHFAVRGTFVETSHPIMGSFRVPGPPYRFEPALLVPPRPAPLFGQHNREVLGELLGLGERQLDELHAGGILLSQPRQAEPGQGAPPLRLSASHAVARARASRLITPQPVGDQRPETKDSGLFHGLRILEFCAHYAGPVAGLLLANHGAQVIKVESATFPDNGRHNMAFFCDFSHSKLGAGLNLKTEMGQLLLQRLVAASDVVIENYAVGVAGRLGIDYERLRRARPDLIMLHLPALGHWGPSRDWVALGPNLMAFTGMTHLWSHPDAVRPVGSQTPYPDYVAASHAVVAVLAALHHRARTGEGCEIELAQAEATAAVLGPLFAGYLVNGEVPRPMGNASPVDAPHGCYRCQGDDAWCAVAVETDERWLAFGRAIGEPTWTHDPRFATAAGRLANREELDRLVEEWTSNYTPRQVMWILQRAGVPAGAVQSNEDLFYDVHLRERGFFTQIDQPGVGPLEYPGPSIRLSATPPGRVQPAPGIGQHNGYVFGELLGLDPEELRRLTAERVLI